VRLEAPASLGPLVSAVAAIRLELKCLGGVTVQALKLDRLRFFLSGEDQLVFPLYELLRNNTREVHLVGPQGAHPSRPTVLSSRCLREVGFGPDEDVLPYTNRSLPGYRLLEEYFTFPKKFLFLDLCELERAAEVGATDRWEVVFLLDRVPGFTQALTPDTFRLGCTPIVNLFEQVAEPVRLSHTQTEYRIIPDLRRQETTEVYSVDAVTSTAGDGQEPAEFQPFYSVRHGTAASQEAYWYATRRPSQKKLDPGTEVHLSLVDGNFNPKRPATETLTVRTTCTNRDLAGKLPFGGDRGVFQLEGAAPLSRIRALTKPTETVRPPLRNGVQWRLISHLSLNHLSIVNGGPEALREILTLYDFSNSAVVRQQIEGIARVTSRQVVARPAAIPGNTFCRGLEVTVEFDEDKYVGSGVFLFASVLERFFGLYCSLNSFVQLIAKTRQREEPLRRWPPRAGDQVLL
jgi:type VI secretion system protein ImpG